MTSFMIFIDNYQNKSMTLTLLANMMRARPQHLFMLLAT